MRHAAETPGSERPGAAGDVGRWFSSAAPSVPGPGHGRRRGTPRPQTTPAGAASGPLEGFGHRSSPEQLREAFDLLRRGPVAVLTGAGMSTGSGLPDYRGRHAVPRSPMTLQEFTGRDLSRRRYWARSTVGWEQFRAARPGPAHHLLAALAASSLRTTAVITQNVDGLHQLAGTPGVIDLHGRLDRVRCLRCGGLGSREPLHRRLLAMNPEVAGRLPALMAQATTAPDGDAEVDRTRSFRYPSCGLCGGMLKPDVVFFGESTRHEVLSQAREAVAAAHGLLVLGSSLTVQSGLRFVRAARRQGAPVVIVNDGPTRADALAARRLHGRLEDVLAGWAQQDAADH